MARTPKGANPSTIKGNTAGRRTVSYRDARGSKRDAVVIGGAGTALDLRIRQGGGGSRTVTAVPKATTASGKQTNVWF